MGNAIFTMLVLVGKTAKVIFFGTLREVEIEVRACACPRGWSVSWWVLTANVRQGMVGTD